MKYSANGMGPYTGRWTTHNVHVILDFDFERACET